jgi:hypothetical protein
MTVEERLEKVERELAALKAGEGVVKAQAFVVEDADGRIRAELGLTKDGPRLRLLDGNGTPRIGLALPEIGPGLALLDANGVNRAWVVAHSGGPILALFDENGAPVWAVPTIEG